MLYKQKKPNSPALCLESGPQCYVGSQLHVGQVKMDRVCYKHCPGVLCGHCPPVAISRPAKCSSVCVWRWMEMVQAGLAAPSPASAVLRKGAALGGRGASTPPDVLDLILKLCRPSASPVDELKSLLLPLNLPQLDTRAGLLQPRCSRTDGHNPGTHTITAGHHPTGHQRLESWVSPGAHIPLCRSLTLRTHCWNT